MYTYSTIPELIELLDKHWQDNNTFGLRYEHDTIYDLFHVTLLQNGNILHEAYFELDYINPLARFWDLASDMPDLEMFLEKFSKFRYKPEEADVLLGEDIQLGEHVMVSDPCYDTDTWCNGDLENVLPGLWHTKALYRNDRCTDLIVWHKDVEEPSFDKYEETNIIVGVDSGQAGVYDYNHFAKMCRNNKWYDSMCTYKARSKMPLSPLEQRCYDDNKDLLPYFHVPVSRLEEFHNRIPICRIKYGINIINFDLLPDGCKIGYEEVLSTDRHSVVSSSGYGDGSYTCYVARNEQGQIIAIRINYITQEELEDEY